MRAVVFANGEPASKALVAEVVRGADLVVAADGGAWKALATGVVPHAVVGDLDSATPELRSALGEATIVHDPAGDRTDLQKAVDYCVAQGAGTVDILCAGGGRADHALANLSVLRLYRGRAGARIIDDLFEVSLVEGVAEIDAPTGAVVSLVAIGRCTGVTTSGLRWELHDATLEFSPLGVHNEVVARPASVRVGDGDLLLFKGRWVEPHG